jgi:hypothetical protein
MPKLTKEAFVKLISEMKDASDERVIAEAKAREARAEAGEPSFKDKVIETWEKARTPLTNLPSRVADKVSNFIDTPQAETKGNLFLALTPGGEYLRRLLGDHAGAKVQGFAGGAIKSIGDLATHTTAPFDLALTASGLGGALAAKKGLSGVKHLSEAVETALQVPLIAEGAVTTGKGVAEHNIGKAIGGLINTSLAGHGVRGERLPAQFRELEHSHFINPELLINPKESPLINGEEYAILTAANPAGKVLTKAENDARNTALELMLKEKGYTPIKQKGVYGGNEEPSYLIPGLPADEAVQLGKHFNQDAVITKEGWHRLADDKVFPRLNAGFDQNATDYYSQVDLPEGSVKYQLAFPDEAFARIDTTAAPKESGLQVAQDAASAPVESLHQTPLAQGGPSASTTTVAPEDFIQFEHRSATPNLAELDPSFYGKGQAGRELARKQAYPEIFPDRSFATVKGGKVEGRFTNSPYTYTGQVPAKAIYDILDDPLNIKAKMLPLSDNDPAKLMTLMENEIKQQGFAGYRAGKHENPTMRDALVLFNKTPVKLATPIMKGAIKGNGLEVELPPTLDQAGIQAMFKQLNPNGSISIKKVSNRPGRVVINFYNADTTPAPETAKQALALLQKAS